MKLYALRYLRHGLLPALLLAAACHKPAPEPEAVPLPAELKAYTLFQPGSYWIYQDSASHQLDSVWVLSTEITVFRSDMGGVSASARFITMKYDNFRLRTRSSRNGIDHIYSVYRVCGLPTQEDRLDDLTFPFPCWYIQRGQYLPNSTADEGSADVFPYSIDQDKTMFINVSTAIIYPYWHSQPSLVGGQVYERVMEVKLNKDASEGGWPAHYYWAPGRGIVLHRVRYQGVMHTQTLLRSHIVQ